MDYKRVRVRITTFGDDFFVLAQLEPTAMMILDFVLFGVSVICSSRGQQQQQQAAGAVTHKQQQSFVIIKQIINQSIESQILL